MTTTTTGMGIRQFIKWYTNCLEQSPYKTKALTSGFVSGSGDLICQWITTSRSNKTDRDDKIDWKRTANFTLLGTFLVAPVMHVWYGALNRYIAPGNTLKQVLKRTFWDQALCAPLFIPTFMISLKTLEGVDLKKEAIPQLQSDYQDLLVTNWTLWIPAQLLNFRYVPVNYQVLCSNVTALVWNIYFSYKTHSHNDKERDDKGDEGSTKGGGVL